MTRPSLPAPGHHLTELLRDALGVRPGEYGRTALFFLYLLFASSIYITSKTVRDALFLTRLPIGALPWMFVGYGIVSPLVAAIHARVVDRVMRHRLVMGTAALAGLSYFGVWVAVRREWSWIYATFYIWAEVVGSLFVSQFWLVANDFHTTRDAKRLYGVIGAGQVMGIVLCGVGISSLAHTLGTENLIWVIVGMMAMCVALVEILRRTEVPVAVPSPAPSPDLPGLKAHPTAQTEGVLASRYARLVAAIIFLLFLVCTVADYQFKAIVRDAYGASKDDMAVYFGRLYGAIGGFAFILQFFFTSRILAHFGLLVGLLVMPIALLASSAWVMVSPWLLAASALKFSDNAFQYSINDASSQLLYFPFPQAAKGRIRAIIDGLFKPIAYAAAGLAVIAAVGGLGVRVPLLGAITIPLIVLWIVLESSVCREYVTALTHTLRDRRLRHGHQTEIDAEGDLLTHQFLLAMVADPDEETALFALETLRRTAVQTLLPALSTLLASPHAKIKRAALELVEEWPDRSNIPGVEALLSEGTPSAIRSAAITAYCAILTEEALDRIVPMVREEDLVVREAVMAGAMKHCGLEGVLGCGAQLHDLLRSTADADRELAARVLGHIGVRHFYRQLLPLFNDRSDRVRIAVAQAAGSIHNPRLIPPLVGMLGQDGAARRASASLVSFGDEAINALDIRLGDPKTPQEVGKAAARVLRRIGTPRSLECLVKHLEHPDERVRRRVLRSAAQVHADLGRPQLVSHAVLEQRLMEELKRAYQVVLDRQVVLAEYPGDVLQDTFGQDWRRSIDRVFSLLRIMNDPDMMRRVRAALLHSRGPMRANALEVLDNATAPHLKLPLLGLFEDLPETERAKRGSLLLGLTAPTAQAWLEAHFQGGGGWHRLAALDAVGLHRLTRFVPNVRNALTDPVPMVREVAAWSLIRLLGADAAPELTVLEQDTAPPIRRALDVFRERYFSPARPESREKEPIMLTTLEEVLFMRHITIFEGVSAEDLSTLAELTEEHFAAAGQTIIKEGEPGTCLYLIVRGQVEVTVEGVRVAVLGPRECFGEQALLDGGPSAASVRAIEPTDLLHISDDDFHELLEDHGEVALNVLRMLSQRLRTMNRKMVDFSQRDGGRAGVPATSPAAPASDDAASHEPRDSGASGA